MKRTLPLLFSTLLLSIAAFASAQQAPPTPSMTVSGYGEARVFPDLATIRLGIRLEAKTAKEVQTASGAVAQRIIDGAVRNGVDRGEVQTGSLTMQPIFAKATGNGAPRKVQAYVAQNTVEIRVKDLRKVGVIIDSSISAGANQVEGVEWGLQSALAARQRALVEAVSAAKEKAKSMAKALGVQLNEVLEVTEGGGWEAQSSYGSNMSYDGAPRAISAGRVSVNATVTIRFGIGPFGP